MREWTLSFGKARPGKKIQQSQDCRCSQPGTDMRWSSQVFFLPQGHTWLKDDEATHCKQCEKDFSISRRKVCRSHSLVPWKSLAFHYSSAHWSAGGPCPEFSNDWHGWGSKFLCRAAVYTTGSPLSVCSRTSCLTNSAEAV